MNITAAIAKLEAIRAEHGDLDILITQSDSNVYSLDFINTEVVENEYSYPKDYNMPKGFKFVCLRVFG